MKNVQKFKVNNMNCNHCVATISKALNNLTGIDSFDINLKKKEVKVSSLLPASEIIKCIEDAGYDVDY